MNNKLTNNNEKKWYQMSASDVIAHLASDENGLTTSEAEARLKKYGYNEIKFKKQGAFARFLKQFRNPLIYVLIIAATITALLDMRVDSLVILAVVFANAIIGFIQEGKAEASIEVLKTMMVPECTVLRDGNRRGLPARELVPGDVVLLEEGNRVPADLRLFYTRNLNIDEAALTGESVPVDKSIETISNPDTTAADQNCMAFSGTFTTRGSGKGIVVATGERTEFGTIAKLMKETSGTIDAPLMRKMARFIKSLVIAILILAAINLILGPTLGGYSFAYSFLASVSFTVAAIPEGLPAILTIALAFGARTMSRRNALIRRLPAVETLGSTTVICSDKTGTLTRNEMTVTMAYSGGKKYNLTGSGYDPVGKFFLDGKAINPQEESDLARTLKAGLQCNHAELKSVDNRQVLSGDPTEGALLVSAAKAGITDKLPRLDEVPFESQEQYMATLHRGENENVVYVKGSPERVLRMCTSEVTGDELAPVNTERILHNVNEMAQKALRVLALGYKQVPSNKTSLTADDMQDLIFLGLQGMIDPPREEAVEAVSRCKKAGIRVVMITGDHALTAEAIAAQLGIVNGNKVLTGEDLSKMSDTELYQVVDETSVYARVAPLHKYRVAKQLQSRGHIVAMTGDGVNDAPALKAADLGIAMGEKGTDITKEAADMVLVDDNFATIVAAVDEGRHVFENIRKAMLYTLATNFGQSLLMLGAILLLPFIALFTERLPLEPVQILWINLYNAVILALPLLWEPREEGLLDRPPRDPKERIANALFFRKVGLVSLIMAVSAFAVFYHYGNPAITAAQVDEMRLDQAQTAAFMTVMTVQIAYLFTARSLTKPVFKKNPLSNKWLIGGIVLTIALHLLLIYVFPEFGFNPFRLEAFPSHWWIPVSLAAVPVIFLVELEDFLAGKFLRRHLPAKPGITPG